MAGTALAVFSIGALVIALGREKHGVEFGLAASKSETRSSISR